MVWRGNWRSRVQTLRQPIDAHARADRVFTQMVHCLAGFPGNMDASRPPRLK